MITNGTITSYAAASGATPEGAVTWGTPVALSARCFLGDVTGKQRDTLGAVIKDATAVAFVAKAHLVASGVVPDKGAKVTATLDGAGGGSRDYRVEYVRNLELRGGLAHFEVFLRGL